MALSDRERRLLAEMEAALASDDPRLQSTLSGDTATLIRRAPGGVLAGLAIVIAGIAILFTGLIAQITVVGIAGFIVALVGVVMVRARSRARGLRLRVRLVAAARSALACKSVGIAAPLSK